MGLQLYSELLLPASHLPCCPPGAGGWVGYRHLDPPAGSEAACFTQDIALPQSGKWVLLWPTLVLDLPTHIYGVECKDTVPERNEGWRPVMVPEVASWR